VFAALLSCGKDDRTAISLRKSLEGPKGMPFKILFGGDTSFAESYGIQQQALLREKGYDYPLAKLKPMIMKSGFIICNLETPITDLKESPHRGKKALLHWTDVEQAPKTYKATNMLAFSLANNHALDYGIDGLKQTIEIMKRTGISWFGAGLNEAEAKKSLSRTFRVQNRIFEMAVVGTFEHARDYDLFYDFYAENDKGGCYKLSPKAIQEQIATLKSENPDTFVVLFPHWGRNYAWKTERQTEYGHDFIKSGADLVIGHGAHGMQEIERYRGKWIIYGLGNFAFLTRGRYKKKNYPPYSCAAQLILAIGNGELERWMRLYPVLSNNLLTNFQPRLLSEEEFEDFTRILVRKSPLSQSDAEEISQGRDEVGHYLQFRLN